MNIRIDAGGMEVEILLLRPPPKKIVGIYARHRRVDFLRGYCRGLVHAGGRIEPIGAFRRGTDSDMRKQWAEPCHLSAVFIGDLCFGFLPEAEWMTLLKPQKEHQ